MVAYSSRLFLFTPECVRSQAIEDATVSVTIRPKISPNRTCFQQYRRFLGFLGDRHVYSKDQASDRAHRIGQERPVTVYRLVVKNSIEEQIVDLHKQKRDLADSLLKGTDSTGKISAQELLSLLQQSSSLDNGHT